jgi:serine O-acetyltransferase
MNEPFWNSFGRDLSRHFIYFPRAGVLKKLALCVLIEGIWAAAVYRFGRALAARGRPAMVFWPLFRAWELAVRLLTGIHLDVGAEIGPGFYVGHHGSIFVGPGARIGADCNIGQMCYVGAAAAAAGAAPQIGSRVYLGPGSKIVGAVKIGDRAAVGAGAVVLDDVPAGMTVLGNPARVVSKAGSDELIHLGERAPLPTGAAIVEGIKQAG